MYYEESLTLIDGNPLSKGEIKRLDREIAHAFGPAGSGIVDRAWLQHKTEIPQETITSLLDAFIQNGTLEPRNEVQCSCGFVFDPADQHCLDCGSPAETAADHDSSNYIVMKQPRQPAFDPEAQPTDPKVFISYRQSDTGKLAADIFYSLMAEGYAVFLDNGEIPAGAEAEQVFLTAASKATHFIALVSPNYFGSAYCKKEFAHAARKKRRILRVNIEPVPDAPSDMTWANAANWVKTKGVATGLSPELEAELLKDVKIKPEANVVDLRVGACEFLLNQLSAQDLTKVWNQMGLHESFVNAPDSKQDRITRILQESIPGKLDQLCDSLAV